MVIQLSNQVNDYHIFNREVLAAADGIVCDVGNGFPDELAIDPTEDFMERIEKLSPSLLSNGLSMRHIRNGNYVIIDHQNGEYSMNCHLRQSIPVKVGDRVKQGQCIGLVGNTGLSMEPHLHFQLMDAADPARANGLPILFSDLPLGTALDSPFFGERNSVLYSEFIFMFVK
ncbi:MAG: peptidoglycan DD-metalloendopeptidase family protein [Planctomycetales bacterium]|nr:peptidoglycan DD-metalloendopeptidase family protein [Planctomycetales bacterium]